jgi:hypothetical protein
MRNKFAFHTDAGFCLSPLRLYQLGFTYETLLGQDYQGHNVFSGSEIIIIDGVQHLHPRARWDDAIHSIFLDTTYISNLIAKVFQRIIGTIMTKHLGITLDDAKNVTVTAVHQSTHRFSARRRRRELASDVSCRCSPTKRFARHLTQDGGIRDAPQREECRTIQKLMRHRHIGTTVLYCDVSDDTLWNAEELV